MSASLAYFLHEISLFHKLLAYLYSEPRLTSTHHNGAHSSSSSTQQEQWVHTREHIAALWVDLECVAGEWKVARGEESVGGDVALYLASHLDWAWSVGENLAELEKTVTHVHTVYTVLAGEADNVSDYLCPMCGKAQLRYRDADSIYYCPACDGAWTAEHLQALRQYRICEAGEWLSVKEASRRYGVPVKTLYTWIRRGKLICRDRRVNSAQLDFLC